MFFLSVLCFMSLLIVGPILLFTQHILFYVLGTVMVAEYIMMSKTTHNPEHHGLSKLVGNTDINPKITLQNVQLQLSQEVKDKCIRCDLGIIGGFELGKPG